MLHSSSVFSGMANQPRRRQWCLIFFVSLVVVVQAMPPSPSMAYIQFTLTNTTMFTRKYTDGAIEEVGEMEIAQIQVYQHQHPHIALVLFSGAGGSGRRTVVSSTLASRWPLKVMSLDVVHDHPELYTVDIFRDVNYEDSILNSYPPMFSSGDAGLALSMGRSIQLPRKYFVVALYSQPHFQGTRVFLTQSIANVDSAVTSLAPLVAHNGSFQVLTRAAASDLLLREANASRSGVVLWTAVAGDMPPPFDAYEILPVSAIVRNLPRGQRITGFGVPSGLVVETFRQPNGQVPAGELHATTETNYVQSFRIIYSNNSIPPRTAVTLYSHADGSGTTLDVMAGEGIESMAFLAHLFPAFIYMAMHVPAGIFVASFPDPNFHGGRTVFPPGFYDELSIVTLAESLQVFPIAEDLPDDVPEDPATRVIVHVKSTRVIKGLYVGLAYPVFPKRYLMGFSIDKTQIVLVYNRPWLLGNYTAYDGGQDLWWLESTLFHAQGLRVLWANETLPPQRPAIPLAAPFVRGYPIWDLDPIELYAGESIPTLIYPWDRHVLNFAVPEGLVVVVFSEPHFGVAAVSRCAAWTTDVVLDESWRGSVRSLQVWNMTSNWTRCPTPTPQPTTTTHTPNSTTTTHTPNSTTPTEPTMTVPIDEIADNHETDNHAATPSRIPSTPMKTPPVDVVGPPSRFEATEQQRDGSSIRTPCPQSTAMSPSPSTKPITPLHDMQTPDDMNISVPKSPAARRPLERVVMWAAILCGVGGVVVAIAVAIVALYRRTKTKRPNIADVVEACTVDYSALVWQDLDLLKLHNAPTLAFTNQVAAGASGAIYRSTFMNELVVVKTFATTPPTASQVQAFIDEIQFHGQLKSSFIVALIGAAWTHPWNLQAVMEYMDMGDLRSHLAMTTLLNFRWLDKLACARSIAEGLFYLHSQNLIHRDLKSRNILLDSVKGTKLADFGSSKEVVYGDTMTAAVGTFRWMAPEMLLFQRYSNAVDIFSFGVVLSELDTHALPYSDAEKVVDGRELSDEAMARLVIHEGLRPSFRKDCPDWFQTLALQCMAANPDDRPSATKIMYILRQEQQ
ncbi:Aste57867_25256 [Aphanomyces stellatus]|uniref:Aste57867_25256 protein n=1 Tax=Aphanomyces stellatus TaxID=120398 RepID=A0A485LSP0_9STRA|nr:hypothetical protein As57867_025178 [Aphanomyces stellatus]VFU01882.1 Aste57867_25256 [Aphanomyces stellatus]